MAREPNAPRTVLVDGDVTLDWNIAHIRRERVQRTAWSGDDYARACPWPGGGALLADLIRSVAATSATGGAPSWSVVGLSGPYANHPSDGTLTHSYAEWAPIKDSPTDPDRWRVVNFLGLDPRAVAAAEPEVARPSAVTPGTAVIVFDDANLGYRSATHAWEPLLREARERSLWIVLKIAQPVAEGALWDRLVHEHADRLITVVTVGDLRRTAVQVSQQISWEQTAEDLTWELTHNAPVNGLSRCAHTIVSFDTAGTLLLAANPQPPANARLVFDPEFMEGEWAARLRGGMIGNTATLTAAIVRELIEHPDEPDIARGVLRGILAMRRLLEHGYDAQPDGAPLVTFPVRRVAEDICADETSAKSPREGTLAIARVQPPLRSQTADESVQTDPSTPWTILGDTHRGGLDELAVGIVRNGLGATINDAPVAHFAKLLSVDRREIEALRSIRALIAEYCERQESRPLSIAVFGPPGAGKSFAVKQVAASARPGAITDLTFNLSQLDGPAGLMAAFHQVRDVSLRGKLPLVFWDEFDSMLAREPLGWLRYFLAPMQDGEFLEGQVCHPIGRAIFVFAGGTAARLADLGRGKMTDEERRDAKIPDFVSRLKGSLEVLGPDPRGGAREGDPFFVVRRAILLRSLLQRSAPELFRGDTARIDSGVLRALLQVSKYAHGARSMESLLAMSQLSRRTEFVRSALPPESQLALHVNAHEFLAHVHRPALAGALLEELAEAFHEYFCAPLRAKGYQLGDTTNDAAKTHSSLKPFAELPPDEQEQNRAAARDVPRKLALRGYVMMPNRRDTPRFVFSTEDIEVLAAEEHQRWMEQKLRNGWQWGPETKKTEKVHQDLVPFEQLGTSEQDKDRQQVRDISRILEGIGYTIVRVPNAA
jgi:hypothetical protein